MSSVIKSSFLRSLQAGEFLVDSVKAESSAGVSQEDAAALIIARAREEAAAIVSAAQNQAESIREQARQQGYETGLQDIEVDRATHAERLAQIEADAARQVEEFWVAIEPQLLKLAVTIASKIVRHEVAENAEHIIATVTAALRQIRDRHELKIRVNPADHELVRARKQDIAASCDGIRSLEIIEDRRVDEGGCIIESNNGHLDARIKTQLKEAERALLEAADYEHTDNQTES